MSDSEHLTERQRHWFATVRATLERDSGRSLEEWAALARACPETAPARRLAWMKSEFGLGRNQASLVLDTAFPPQQGWSTPQALAAALWRDPLANDLFERLKARATALPDVIVGQRKGFTGFSRNFQFAAARPAKQALLLGLAVPPDTSPRLQPAGKEGWSERLKSKMAIGSADEIDDDLSELLQQSWERS